VWLFEQRALLLLCRCKKVVSPPRPPSEFFPMRSFRVSKGPDQLLLRRLRTQGDGAFPLLFPPCAAAQHPPSLLEGPILLSPFLGLPPWSRSRDACSFSPPLPSPAQEEGVRFSSLSSVFFVFLPLHQLTQRKGDWGSGRLARAFFFFSPLSRRASAGLAFFCSRLLRRRAALLSLFFFFPDKFLRSADTTPFSLPFLFSPWTRASTVSGAFTPVLESRLRALFPAP